MNPTADEIKDIIAAIWAKIKEAMDAGRWPADLEPVYSLDNATIHKSAVKDWDKPRSWRRQLGIRGRIMFVPDLSPDLHQVIEHAHANCVRLYQRIAEEYLRGVRKMPKDVAGFIPHVKKCFEEGNPLKSIKANVLRMKKVYEGVIAAGGDFVGGLN